MEIPITARYPRTRLDWIYLFDDDEITKVKVMSGAQYVGVVLVAAFGVFFLFIFVLISLPIGPAAIISIVIFGLAFGSPFLIHAYQERKVSAMSLEQVMKRKSTQHIPWSSVEEVQMKQYYMKIRTSQTTHRVALLEPDADAITSFVVSKLGDKVSAKY